MFTSGLPANLNSVKALGFRTISSAGSSFLSAGRLVSLVRFSSSYVFEPYTVKEVIKNQSFIKCIDTRKKPNSERTI